MSQPALQTLLSPSAFTTLSDEEVVERVLAGDASLFEILMRRYNQRLFRELANFRGEARFSTWLTRIACHEALARARKQRRLVQLVPGGDSGGPPEPPSETAGPERELENRELQTVLRDAVEVLPDPLRAVFCLREIEGLSTEQTAEALDLTLENVRVRLHRAKRSLRDTLDERIGCEVRRLYLFEAPRCDRMVATVFTRLDLGADR